MGHTNSITQKIIKSTRITAAIFAAVALLSTLSAAGAPIETTPMTPTLVAKVVAYVPNWIKPDSFAGGIDYSGLTHINVAFENPVDDNGELSFNPRDSILIALAHTNHVKILVSIGGGGASGNKQLLARYANLLSDSNRAGFVAKIADYVVDHDFDGLDLDLEGPAVGPDYGAFAHDLAAALRPQGKLLTAAVSQGYGGKSIPDSVFADFDSLNIMAYDGKGPWDPDSPGQHSSFDFSKSSVDYWLGRGLPKSKAVLGLPFYGYGFGADFRKWGYPYSEIVAKYPGAENMDQVGNTIWYNGIPTMKAKAKYVLDQGLGGVMIWSLDQDAPDNRSLLNAIDETFRQPGH